MHGILNEAEFLEVNDSVTSCLALAALGAEQNDRGMLTLAARICLDATNAVYGDIGGHIFQYDVRVNDEHAFDQITNDITVRSRPKRERSLSAGGRKHVLHSSPRTHTQDALNLGMLSFRSVRYI